MKKSTLAGLALITGLAVTGAAGATSAGAIASSGSCSVIAQTPSTRYVAGIPSATAGRAQYHCGSSARLTIKLVKYVPILPDTSLPAWYYDVPARSTWSGVYSGPEANCAAYGHGAQFRTEATLTFGGHSITDKGDWFKSC